MNKFHFIFILAVIIASFAQILLKIGAQRKSKTMFRQYANWQVLFGYFLMICSMIFNLIAYREIPLKLGPIFDSLGFIFIPFLSWLILDEKLTIKKLIGFFIIVVGIIIFSI